MVLFNPPKYSLLLSLLFMGKEIEARKVDGLVQCQTTLTLFDLNSGSWN